MKNLEKSVGTAGIAQRMTVRQYDAKKEETDKEFYIIKYNAVMSCTQNQY